MIDSRSSQIKNATISIYCLSAKQAVLRSMSKYWLCRNRVNLTECGHVCTRYLQGLCEGGSVDTLVRGPGSREGVCESIALAIDVFYSFGGGLIFNFFSLFRK